MRLSVCRVVCQVVLVMCLWAGGAVAQAEEPVEVSGRYPHLMVTNSQQESGIGALAEWADRLWFITYSPHMPEGSDDKLYELTDELELTARPESIGGTPANRMIHEPSNQLIIGPYFIDAERNVRAIPYDEMFGRHTATAEHLTEPERKVYFYDMEGLHYEVDVQTLEVERLFVRPVPGWHAKGAYTGQGRFIVANNGEWEAGSVKHLRPYEYQVDFETGGERAGVLAEWDGEDWRVIRRRQFTEVTGPGGIHGAPNDEAPVWATGWDKRSLMLMVRHDGEWHEYRLPKADYSYDGHHGWHTEWPRIREAVSKDSANSRKLLMNKHGGWFDFPQTFSAEDASGLRPIGSYLKIISDHTNWNGRIVFACNETSMFNNPLAGQAQSNLWFAEWEELHEKGAPVGWGGPWVADDVAAGQSSSPYLFGGYGQRVLHVAHETDEPVTLTVEVDTTGRGDWQQIDTVTADAEGYAFHVFDADVPGEWIRLTPEQDAAGLTAYFHYGPSRGAATDEAMFAGLADVQSDGPYTAGVIRPRGAGLGTLHYLSEEVEGDAVRESRYYEIGEDMNLAHKPDDTTEKAWLRDKATVEERDYEMDAASLIVSEGDKRWRIPKGHAAYEAEWPGGLPRGVREVVTERALLNAGGTFFMLPRENSGGVMRMKPVATHNKRITDFCTWRGMLVLAGARAEAESDGQTLAADDGQAALWFGDVDDLWKLGKPTGRGGPWKESAVEAGEASDPYLMTGYDEKQVSLSHDADETVTFTIEVDVTATGDFVVYEQVEVPAGETVTHQFPDGFAAHWVRTVADTACEATAWFVYE